MSQVDSGNSAEADKALKEQLRLLREDMATMLKERGKILEEKLKSEQSLKARTQSLIQKIKDAKVSNDKKVRRRLIQCRITGRHSLRATRKF